MTDPKTGSAVLFVPTMDLPAALHKVGWWRRIIGRDRYYMGHDPAHGSDKAAWYTCRVDTKTGVTTVLEYGTFEPPANDQAEP